VNQEIEGFAEVLQHTPRAETDELPIEVTLPPAVAEFDVILVAVVVVTVGGVPPPFKSSEIKISAI